MNTLNKKLQNHILRQKRIRAKISGTTTRPRLSVRISNKHVTAQIIDDSKQVTLLYVSTVGAKAVTGNMTERAAWVGSEIAKKALKSNIKSVVFDRGGHLYHGRVKVLAEAARTAGMEF